MLGKSLGLSLSAVVLVASQLSADLSETQLIAVLKILSSVLPQGADHALDASLRQRSLSLSSPVTILLGE